MVTIEKIKTEARRMVRKHGLINLTREGLAAAIGVPDGSFKYVAGRTFTSLVRELKKEKKLMMEQPAAVVVEKGRTNPELRRDHILIVALELARVDGFINITRAEVAKASGVSDALVSHYLGSMDDLRKSVMEEAVKRGVVEVVAQGLAIGHPAARLAPNEVKKAALDWMA